MYIIPNDTKQSDVISGLAEADECAFNHSPQLAPGTACPGRTWSDLTDPPPSRTSTWSIRSPGRAPPLNFYTDSITANANHFFASGTLSPPHSSDRFRAGRGWLGPHCPRRSLHNTCHFRGQPSRPPNWTRVNETYVYSKSRYLQGLSRFNRAPTDLTQSSPSRQTPFWTPIS